MTTLPRCALIRFSHPVELVEGATAAAGSAAPTSTHSIGDVDLMLHLADLLLRPQALRLGALASGGGGAPASREGKARCAGCTPPPPCPPPHAHRTRAFAGCGGAHADAPTLSASFLTRWLAFLAGVRNCIHGMLPEEQAVKVLAALLKEEYEAGFAASP